MIKVKSTTRRYGSLTAVDRVSFEVDKNEIVGFVGPNGAGKSTMLKMLSTFIHPTEGSITVAGHDAVSSPLAVRHNIGYLSGDTPLWCSGHKGAWFRRSLRNLGSAVVRYLLSLSGVCV